MTDQEAIYFENQIKNSSAMIFVDKD